jgi:hypothetical protein
MNNVCLSDKEYEIVRESYLYENTKGLEFVMSKMVSEGISEQRARIIMDNTDSLCLTGGKIVVVRRRRTSESVIAQYFDIRAIVLGLVTFLLAMVVYNIDKIIRLILK